MLLVLMLFCAAGAVLLIALGGNAELQDLRPYFAKHSAVPHPSEEALPLSSGVRQFFEPSTALFV
jgi:hypothetical protein